MESHHIHKLDEITINRIAAGEIIQRPSGVVKELIENSIDAGSTAIIVTSSGGGMDTLQIQDNGCGIYKSDMEIVCERFTTSKISTFDDLKTVTTFGFRGEALASISHVSRVTISSKTKNEQCAYKAKYCDGKMVPFKQGENIQLKACAGNIGTTILVEDLFYNMLNRRLAFSNHNDEHQRVVDVVVKYAVHYGDKHISFTCKKPKSQSPDFHLSANTSISTLHAIQIAYGAALAKELLLLSDFSTSDTISSRYDCTLQTTKADVLNYTVHGYLSNSNFSKKKGIFILFINNRLVESQNIKKLIESVYNEFLPKNTYPFVYLSICLPPEHVDVNVHPTKKEVHFLHEEELLECLLSRTQALLRNSNDSRVFYLQPTLQQFSQSNKGGQEIWETGTGNYDDQIISSKRKHEDIIEGIVDDERSNIQSQVKIYYYVDMLV
jgi:DNA mismatch repair protein MLH1